MGASLLFQWELAPDGCGGGRGGGGGGGVMPQEWPQFVEQSLGPIVVILGSSFLVAVLSRQFLRVVTEWRRSREESKAERMRKIQQLICTFYTLVGDQIAQ